LGHFLTTIRCKEDTGIQKGNEEAGIKSPDEGDAVALTFAHPVNPAAGSGKKRARSRNWRTA